MRSGRAAYRTAAFQPLALLAWRTQLTAWLPEGQVRAYSGGTVACMRGCALREKGVSGERPGSTRLTRTPMACNSSASDSVQAFRAALLAV